MSKFAPINTIDKLRIFFSANVIPSLNIFNLNSGKLFMIIPIIIAIATEPINNK